MIGWRHLRDVRVKDAVTRFTLETPPLLGLAVGKVRVLRNLYFSEPRMLPLKIWYRLLEFLLWES